MINTTLGVQGSYRTAWMILRGNFAFYTCERKMRFTYVTFTYGNVIYTSVTHVNLLSCLSKSPFSQV